VSTTAVATPGNGDENEKLRNQIRELQERVNELETDKNLPASRSAESDVTPLSEADVTLRRLVQRIAMILQAEKIVIMFYDHESGDVSCHGTPALCRLPLKIISSQSRFSGLVTRSGGFAGLSRFDPPPEHTPTEHSC